MARLSIINPLLMLAFTLALSGCIYDQSSSMANSGTQAATDAEAAKLAANGSTQAPESVQARGGGPLGGYIEQFMDANDRSKMTRALDGSLGRSVSWTNPVSGANFSVTPTSKASGEGICRNYTISMNKSGVSDRVSGVACIGDDGVWHVS